MKTVVIDAGHGGADFGAVNGTRYEKNDNLRMAQAVQNKLAAQNGVQVVMTRDSDEFIPLIERSNISNRANADIFVSLHRNAASNPQANGVENYVAVGASPTSVSYARNVLNEVVDVGVQSNRGLKQENFSVLRYTNAPAQLLELGFITNETDNTYFDRYFDAYATAIARGIMRSLGLTFVTPPVTPPGNDRITIIKSIQTRLNQLYGAGLVVDGVYGPNTRRGLIRGLQTELNRQYGAGLTVDGVFGPMTRAAIRNVRRGATGNIVWILQATLFANGYDPGALDGAFGKMTEEALLNFQYAKGLVPDAVAGPATFAALLT